MLTLKILSWSAVILLAFSYWLQIWKIHKHKEVRDLSIAYYIFLLIGFSILLITAYAENSTLFMVKQIVVIIPVIVTIAQVIYHQGDKWHDDNDEHCNKCKKELEPHWKHCAYCGTNSNYKKIRKKKVKA
jgi:uncharacterized protein with PQ loop repeat